MLPFQKTKIYLEAHQAIKEIINEFNFSEDYKETKNINTKKNNTGSTNTSTTETNSTTNKSTQKSHTVIKKLENQGIDLISNIAKELSQQSSIQTLKFEDAQKNIYGIIAILDFAHKNLLISEEKRIKLTEKINKLSSKIRNFNDNRKRIMILSAEMGQGHMSVSKAIKESFEYRFGYDYIVEIIDFQEVISSLMNSFTKTTYENWVKFTPSLYKLLYESTNTSVPLVKIINQANYPFVINKLTKFFQEKNPDLVISTFPVWSYLASEIRKKANKNSKFVSIVTDSITIHTSWVMADNDYILVANNDTATSIKKLGVPTNKIKVLGYPIRLDFMKETKKTDFLKEIGLDPNRFTILFLPTSQQQKKNIKIIEKLTEKNDFNIIIITGRDKKLKPKLEVFSKNKNIKIFGWTDRMPEFIKASDIVITKAGGSTVMECISAQKPIIITSIIPGQEEGNAELINRYNLGVVTNLNKGNILEEIELIRKNYKTHKENLKKISRPEASLSTVDFLITLL